MHDVLTLWIQSLILLVLKSLILTTATMERKQYLINDTIYNCPNTILLLWQSRVETVAPPRQGFAHGLKKIVTMSLNANTEKKVQKHS